jgi:hypothetical protein
MSVPAPIVKNENDRDMNLPTLLRRPQENFPKVSYRTDPGDCETLDEPQCVESRTVQCSAPVL